MAEKARKRKPAAKSVLGTLPAKRPERIGSPRNGTAKPRAAKPRPAKRKPRAVSPGSPPLARPHKPPPKPLGAPTGTELVTTAIQATGELARIGWTVGGQVLKRAVDRLPRP